MLYVLLFLAVLDVGLLAVNDVIMELIGVWWMWRLSAMKKWKCHILLNFSAVST